MVSPHPLTKLSSVQGKWIKSANWNWIVDPLNGEKFIKVGEVQGSEIKVLMLWGASLLTSMLQCYECNLVISINFCQLFSA